MNGGIAPIAIAFDRGSLTLTADGGDSPHPLPEFLTWDDRIGAYRCHAIHYRALVRHFTRLGVCFTDAAADYPTLSLHPTGLPEPYPFQREALAAWLRGKRGTVELPTGSGKTIVGLHAISRVQRGTLVLVPTLDLAAQWCDAVEIALGIVPGMVGGGSFSLQPVTVCTYASAYLHAERFGARFGLAIFDECHHLAGARYRRIAEAIIAPYRLGISATLEGPDMARQDLVQLIGPVVYRKGINELSGSYLADYDVRVLHAELNETERAEYGASRAVYLDFVRECGVQLDSPRGWQQFIFAASRSAQGRSALEAYYRQKRIAFAAEDKFRIAASLLERHRGERVIVFTNDNATAYEVSRRFLLPIITHQTPLAERREILARFQDGRWPTVVTSKVLNEGVDLPAAGVALILSGTASVREHVQRLGRILRKYQGKRAVLYEILTRHTTEESTSERRRRHDAYR